MSRRLLLVLVCAFGAAGCSVQVTGAACLTDENCPTGQVCEAGLCVEGKRCDCVAGNTRCAADGTIVQCVDDGTGCFSFARGGGQACTRPEVCVQAQNAAACACPSPGEVEGTGCSSAGEVVCGGQAVLECERRDSCLVWTLVEDCGAAGVACVEERGTAACSCPANDGTELYVDPLHGRAAASVLPPTGAANPPSCRYPRVSDALPLATSGSTIILTGFDRVPWNKLTRYAVGDQVVPTTRNGFLYVAVQAGLGGTVEPSWPIAPDATVGDNEVVWKRLTLDAVAFELETFPLTVPAGVTLRSEGCLADDAGCDPTRYAVLFNGANGGAQAAQTFALGEGATLSGFTVLNVGGNAQSAAIECTTGAVTVRRMILLGARDQSTQQANGMVSTGGCSLTLEDSAIGRYGRGVFIDSLGATTLSRLAIGQLGMQELPVGIGLGLHAGVTSAQELRIGNARLQGVVVDGVDTEATLRACEVSGSGGGAATPDDAAPGVEVRAGQLTLIGSALTGNLGPGLSVLDGAVVSSADGAEPNRINENGSDGQTAPESGAGIRMAGGAISGEALEVKGNRADGILVEQGAVTLTEAVITENRRDGVYVSGPGVVQLVGGAVTESGEDNVATKDASASVSLAGVRVANATRHGILAGGGQLTLEGALVEQNGSTGITQPIFGTDTRITITGTDVAGNIASGIDLFRGRLSLERCSVFGNGATSAHSGVKLSTSVTVDAFKVNKLYANRTSQLHVYGNFIGEMYKVPQSCGTDANHVSCYPVNSVGVRATGVTALAADGIRFKNGVPVAGVDYEGPVTPGGCGSALVTCP